MDMNIVYALLIASAPVILSVLLAKRYNVVHGLITFLFTGYLLLFALSYLGKHLPADITKYLYGVEQKFAFLSLYNGLYFVFGSVLNLIGLGKYLTGGYAEYVILGAYVLLFIISHIIAVGIRRHRINGIKALRRQVKRY